MKEITVDAKIENVDEVTDFVNCELTALGCSEKTKATFDVAIDELFSNISNYAYNPDVGKATIRVESIDGNNSVTITFIDSGVPYNPLLKEDPNANLKAEERSIGGLGIFIVKKSMDNIEYEYKDGKNILKIRKNIER